MICKCCGKSGREARNCKAPFSKRWPGKPAVKFKVRTPMGTEMELTMSLTPDQWDKVNVLFQTLCGSWEDA